MKLLLIAPYADRDDVGEARSTWAWADGVSRRATVDVVACVKHGRLDSLRESLPSVRSLVAWEDSKRLANLGRFNDMAKPGLIRFARHVSRWSKPRLRGREYDLVHQLAPLAPRHGPLLRQAFGTPFVLGPVAGSIRTPATFRHEVVDPWFVRLRAFDHLRYGADPFLRRRYSIVSHLVGVAPYVREILDGCYTGPVSYESEVGVAHASSPRGERQVDKPLQLLFVGRLIRTKGVRDLVAAVLRMPDQVKVSLDVLGEGVEKPVLEEMIREAGGGSRVTLHGQVPREKVSEYYQRADVFVFPSFREPSGNVVIEAMSHGLPVVTVEGGGPAHAVQDAGIVIPPTDPERLRDGLRRVIEDLAGDPGRLKRLSEAAVGRVESLFLWPGKVDRMMRLYDQLRSETSTE